jgi:hypothetical protein
MGGWDTLYLAQAQRQCFAREDEVTVDDHGDGPKEYRMMTVIPLSLVNSGEYWHHLVVKCGVLSTQLADPSFPLRQ